MNGPFQWPGRLRGASSTVLFSTEEVAATVVVIAAVGTAVGVPTFVAETKGAKGVDVGSLVASRVVSADDFVSPVNEEGTLTDDAVACCSCSLC